MAAKPRRSTLSVDPKKITGKIVGMTSPHSHWLAAGLMIISGLGLGWLGSSYRNMASENTRLAVENEQMRLGDERMARGRTNFARPGITEEEVQIMEAIAADYGMPPEVLYAFRQTENGGRMLFLGAQSISPEIRKRYPPLWWQFAQGAKMWTKHLNNTALGDPYLRHRTLWSFAKQWNPEPDKWTESVLANLERSRGATSLAVTEPPRKSPSGAQAKGGGHKPSKHKRKEKKR